MLGSRALLGRERELELLGQRLRDAAASRVITEIRRRSTSPPFADLFRQAVELGDAKLFPCSMAMDILALRQDDLEPYVGEPMGLTQFLDDAAEGQVWSF